MAWAVEHAAIGTVNGASSASTTITLTTDTTIGSDTWIEVEVASFSSNTVSSVVDNGPGLTWQSVAQFANGSTRIAKFRAWCPSGMSSGTVITATYSASTSFRAIGGTSFTGGAAASGVESTVSASGSTAAWSVSPVASAAGELVPGGGNLNNTAGGHTEDANSTEAWELSVPSSPASYTLVYREAPGSGSTTVGGTWSGANTWIAAGAAFSITQPLGVQYVTSSTVPTGTTATSTTTTLNLTYPADIQAGDKLIVGVGVKPDTATVSTPSGYTAPSNADANGGGGTTGVDTGPTRMAVFERDADGTESGTLTITLANSPNVSWGMILVFRKVGDGAAGATWDLAAANGIDSTTGTPFTATMGTNPGLEAGDKCAIFGCIPTDVTTPAQFSSPTLTATGMTASATEIGEPDTTSGNDIGGVVLHAAVTAGPASAAPTFSTTAGGTTTNVRGPIVLVRLRSVAAGPPPSSTQPFRALMGVGR